MYIYIYIYVFIYKWPTYILMMAPLLENLRLCVVGCFRKQTLHILCSNTMSALVPKKPDMSSFEPEFSYSGVFFGFSRLLGFEQPLWDL